VPALVVDPVLLHRSCCCCCCCCDLRCCRVHSAYETVAAILHPVTKPSVKMLVVDLLVPMLELILLLFIVSLRTDDFFYGYDYHNDDLSRCDF
jgi:hypothetical protein